MSSGRRIGTPRAWSRREVLGAAAVAGLASNASRALPARAPAASQRRAREEQLDFLDRRSYIHNMDLLAHHYPGQNRPGKMQMMALGERRYLFQHVFKEPKWNWLNSAGQILDVTDPLKPEIVNERGFFSFSIQVVHHAPSDRWVMMTAEGGPRGLPVHRGVRFLDVTDPTRVREISRYSTDGGDPMRRVQEGSGTHRDYWDGGRYAYLGASPNDDFYYPEKSQSETRSLQVIDLEELERPKKVGQWWVPGQRKDEVEAREQWRSKGDPLAFDNFHGPLYVPRRIEDGGRYGYGGWGTFGMLIHDLSDPTQPKLVSRWDTEQYIPGPMMPHHTVDPTRVDRGFVITSPESLAPDCAEAWHDSWIIDVREPRSPRAVAKLPVPEPPPDAPYTNFCQKRGRFGVHNAPHVKAPGKPHPGFTAYTYFNGGLQCYDISAPLDPRISAWFVPPQAGDIGDPETFERSADSVFIEWDRRLIWLGSSSGLHLLSTPELGEPVLGALEVERWSFPL